MLKCFNQASNLLSLASRLGGNDDDNYSNLLQISKDKPFYFELQQHNHKDDCFNCLIGCPLKNNKEYPLFEYEKNIIDS